MPQQGCTQQQWQLMQKKQAMQRSRPFACKLFQNRDRPARIGVQSQVGGQDRMQPALQHPKEAASQRPSQAAMCRPTKKVQLCRPGRRTHTGPNGVPQHIPRMVWQRAILGA